ncbi:hypothetical protein AWENTII_009853 [Aspergillus wentii]|nr:hypothetical protein MW887_006603 [Aspergillus wentii]
MPSPPPKKQTLLVPSKRPLHPPTKSKPTVINPSSVPADIQLSSSRETPSNAGIKTVEVDLSKAPQPFLDPDVWEKMRGLGRGEGEGEGEGRMRGQEEFGEMAVKGRKAVRKMR